MQNTTLKVFQFSDNQCNFVKGKKREYECLIHRSRPG